MMRQIILLSLALLLAACGVQRPLIRPKDIPAYEEQQRQKRQEILDEQKELEAIDAKRAATPTNTSTTASPPESP